jgi:hypothetical protein
MANFTEKEVMYMGTVGNQDTIEVLNVLLGGPIPESWNEIIVALRDDETWWKLWRINCIGKMNHFLWPMVHNSCQLALNLSSSWSWTL